MTNPLYRCLTSALPWVILHLSLGAALMGCSRSEPAKEPEQTKSPVPLQVIPAKTSPSSLDARLHQPFLEAVLLEPPEDQFQPPDRTAAGKSTGKMYEEIAGVDGNGGLWDKIIFANADGKRINYTATLRTDQGDVTIEFFPDVAPNHVRNFLALAQVGYYNGLAFDRAVRQEVEGEKDANLEYLEAGCPLGTAEPGYGSIGYWLKPEFTDKVSHLEGTVGACHGEELESAAAKFYITLSKAPWMDGNWTVFGKVTQGLDVARKIFQRPVRDDYFRPQEPVLIREVTIQAHQGDAK